MARGSPTGSVCSRSRRTRSRGSTRFLTPRCCRGSVYRSDARTRRPPRCPPKVRLAPTKRRPTRAHGGMSAADAACVVGLLYACASVYWVAGGTWLLDTVGGSFARLGHARDTTLILAIWGPPP